MVIQDVRKLAHACIDDIASTLITEQRDFRTAEFKLDEFQKKLLDTKSRFVRVVAPAGSGKTKSLTAKAAEILKREPTARILCLAFTNAAANEFKERAMSVGFSALDSLRVSTVNSFGYDVVKDFLPSHRLASQRSFWGMVIGAIRGVLTESPILKPEDQNFYLNQIAELSDFTKSLGFSHDESEKQVESRYAALRALKISAILEEKMQDAGLLERSESLFAEEKPEHVFTKKWFPFWVKLTTKLWQSSVITLEDQKYWALQLLATEPRSQAWLQRQKVTHVMVDEFQDINYLDLNLIGQIVHSSNASLFIVGDDDQCIYEWRGCTSHFIREPDRHLAFLEKGLSFETVLLERNYRCPRNIVAHASQLISHNRNRIEKRIQAVQTQDANIRVVPLPAAYVTMHVVDELVASLAAKHPEHSVAILGRKKCQLLPLQILLTKRGTRFYLDGDLNVFLGAAFTAFKEVLRLPPTRAADVGMARALINFMMLLDRVGRAPVSKAEREQITKFLQEHNTTTLERAVAVFGGYSGPFKRGKVEPSAVALKLNRFLESKTVADALLAASETMKGFEKDFRKAKDDIFFSDPPFSHLVDLAVDYDQDFGGFILDIEKTIQDAENHSRRGPKIELMTALRAKGREFDTVIILDANDTIWPSKPAVERGYLEEERRLFYVAVSRTKNNLLLFESGRVQGKLLNASPFISELGLPATAWIRNPQLDVVSKELLSNMRI